MPTITLTARGVSSLKPDPVKQVDYFDETLPGFSLRISPGGRKAWNVVYRYRRRVRRLKLGTFPPLELAAARLDAKAALKKAARGEDPAAVKQETRSAQTFGELAALFLTKHAKIRKRSWQADEGRIARQLLPSWKHVPAREIRRQDVRALLEAIAEEHPIEANRTFALIRKIYNFGLGQDLEPPILINPCAALERPAAEHQRDRVLSESEIRTFWRACDALPLVMAAFYKLRLVTAQRAVEVASMRWADLDGDWWTISAGVSKNGLPHRVPITPTMRRILKVLPRTDDDYVLSGARGKRQQGEAAATFHIDNFRAHDLRRTAASLMAGGTVPRLIVSKVLNHAEAGVTAVYDRHSYDAEKQAALAWWDAKLAAILKNAKRSRVLPFGRSG